MTAVAPDPSDAAQLAALAAAIPDLVRQLGGTLPPGSWDYEANRLRIQHRPGAGISAMYAMPAGTGFNELGASTEKVSRGGTRGAAVGSSMPGGGAGLLSAWQGFCCPTFVLL